ncbi:hypothetical protein V8C86DRAFT_2637379 [Haematococcus lacustris]
MCCQPPSLPTPLPPCRQLPACSLTLLLYGTPVTSAVTPCQAAHWQCLVTATGPPGSGFGAELVVWADAKVRHSLIGLHDFEVVSHHFGC